MAAAKVLLNKRMVAAKISRVHRWMHIRPKIRVDLFCVPCVPLARSKVGFDLTIDPFYYLVWPSQNWACIWKDHASFVGLTSGIYCIVKVLQFHVHEHGAVTAPCTWPPPKLWSYDHSDAEGLGCATAYYAHRRRWAACWRSSRCPGSGRQPARRCGSPDRTCTASRNPYMRKVPV